MSCGGASEQRSGSEGRRGGAGTSSAESEAGLLFELPVWLRKGAAMAPRLRDLIHCRLPTRQVPHSKLPLPLLLSTSVYLSAGLSVGGGGAALHRFSSLIYTNVPMRDDSIPNVPPSKAPPSKPSKMTGSAHGAEAQPALLPSCMPSARAGTKAFSGARRPFPRPVCLAHHTPLLLKPQVSPLLYPQTQGELALGGRKPKF